MVEQGLNFTLSEEQEAFRRSVRQFVEDKVAPRAAEVDESDEYPWDLDELMVKSGFTGVSYPEEYGGNGGGALELALMIEEISRSSAGIALVAVSYTHLKLPTILLV